MSVRGTREGCERGVRGVSGHATYVKGEGRRRDQPGRTQANMRDTVVLYYYLSASTASLVKSLTISWFKMESIKKPLRALSVSTISLRRATRHSVIHMV